MNLNFDIEKFLTLEGYDNETRKSRRKTGEKTQEFFTPYSIVKKMADKISDEDWSDPDKTFLEPTFGNGQFVCFIVYKRLTGNVDWKTALETLYGVELMEDNVIETKNRVIDLLNGMGIDFDEETARDIMDKNLVCSDFFKWDFERWEPLEKRLF